MSARDDYPLLARKAMVTGPPWPLSIEANEALDEIDRHRDGQLPRLKWKSKRGQLADALGIPRDQPNAVVDLVQSVVDSGGGIANVLDAIQEQFPQITFEEWTAAVYALGHFDAVVNGGKR